MCMAPFLPGEGAAVALSISGSLHTDIHVFTISL